MSDYLTPEEELVGLRAMLVISQQCSLYNAAQAADYREELENLYDAHSRLLDWAYEREPGLDLTEILRPAARDGLWNS